MKFSTVLAPLALASTAAAGSWNKWSGSGSCISDAQVQSIIDTEIIFLQHTDIEAARTAAYSIFAPDIVEYGDSINSLRGAPVGTLVEPDRETYVNNTLSAPGIPQIITLNIVHDCSTIVWQWSFIGVGTNEVPRVNGFTLAKLNSDNLINYQYVEFNSLAWAINSGFTVTPPTTGPFAPPSSKVRRAYQA